MSHESKHSKAKIAAELGVAGLGLAAAGTAGYLAYRRHRLEAQRSISETDIPNYLSKLALFANEKVDHLIPNGRHVMAAAAVRIFYASRDSIERNITKEQLLEQFAESNDLALQTTAHKLQKVLGFLAQQDLIGRRPSETNPQAHGYYALPALEWGLEYGECPEVLVDAQDAFIGQQL